MPFQRRTNSFVLHWNESSHATNGACRKVSTEQHWRGKKNENTTPAAEETNKIHFSKSPRSHTKARQSNIASVSCVLHANATYSKWQQKRPRPHELNEKTKYVIIISTTYNSCTLNGERLSRCRGADGVRSARFRKRQPNTTKIYCHYQHGFHSNINLNMKMCLLPPSTPLDVWMLFCFSRTLRFQ